MNIISIGTDRKIFETDSQVRKRIVGYGEIFDEVHIIVFSLNSFGVKEKRVNISENVFAYPTNSKSRTSYITDALNIARKIAKEFKSNGKNFVVTTQDPFETGLVGLFIKLIYKIPLQIQIHTDFANRYFIFHSLLNLIRFPLGIFILSFADSVRVVSQKIADSIHTLSHNVNVLPVYTKFENKGISKSQSMDRRPFNCLTVCRLEKEKDLETAIKAFKVVSLKFPGVTFMIVGEGSQREKLENLSVALGLKDRIYFAGWQNDLDKYYQKADVYISTSLYEGYGMSVVEAASYGIPLVLSKTGVAGSVFKDGESALVYKQKDVEGFSQGLIKIIEDSNLREVMGNSAREAALREAINYDEYLKRYRESLKLAVEFYNSGHGVFKKNILLRYLAAGVSGAGTQICLLYLFTDVVGIWYLYSSIISFGIAVFISFTLQKFWTFKDKETNAIHHQFIKYFILAILGLLINSIMMYLMVDMAQVWYLLAQIITSAIIALINFVAYKFFIFDQK